uniref:Cystatin domain-containing protein n=2 Tax=Peromyscus maniculatus bairdii TaxID=230844 RepID=A0A8C8W711_PERMB
MIWKTMACLFHVPLLLLTTLMVAMNLSLNPVLGDTLLGGIEKSSMQEERAPEALEYAVSKYNEYNNDLHLSRVIGVQRVQNQVMCGTKFYFDVILGKTICKKTQANLTNCPLNDQSDQQETKFCSFDMYVVPWQNHMFLTTFSCHKM